MSERYPSIRRGSEIRIVLDVPISVGLNQFEDISLWPITAEVRLAGEGGQKIGDCIVTKPTAYQAVLSFVTTSQHPVGNYYLSPAITPTAEPVIVTEAIIVQVRP